MGHPEKYLWMHRFLTQEGEWAGLPCLVAFRLSKTDQSRGRSVGHHTTLVLLTTARPVRFRKHFVVITVVSPTVTSGLSVSLTSSSVLGVIGQQQLFL